MGFMENLQETLNEGFAVSRDLLHKAADKAKEMGEKGVVHMEIRQLQNQSAKATSQLGLLCYRLLRGEAAEEASTDLASHPDVLRILNEIDDLKNKIEEKQQSME